MSELHGSCEQPVGLQTTLTNVLLGAFTLSHKVHAWSKPLQALQNQRGKEVKEQAMSLLPSSLLPSSAPWGSPGFKSTPFQRDTWVFTARLKSVPRSSPSRAVLLSDLVLGSSPGTQETMNALSKCSRWRSSHTETCLTELLRHRQPRRDTAITYSATFADSFPKTTLLVNRILLLNSTQLFIRIPASWKEPRNRTGEDKGG